MAELQSTLEASRGDGLAVGRCGGGGGGGGRGRGAVRLGGGGSCFPVERAPHGGPERAPAPAHDQARRVPPHRRGRLLLLVYSRFPRPIFFSLSCVACLLDRSL